MTRQPSHFASSTEAEAGFYLALERGDLDAMLDVWAEDEEIVCIHPGGPRIAGAADVFESWRQIFAGGGRIALWRSHLSITRGPMFAIHSLYEHIPSGPGESYPPIAVTNIYVRGALGWRMLVHHASPTPERLTSLGDESGRQLH